MASQIKISQLPEVTTVGNSDVVIVDNGTTTSKATKTNLLKEVNTSIGNKVDKVTGKGLSTNDYTTTEKNKLAGIEDGANKYVLPSNVVQDSSYVHTDNNYTTAEKTKLAGLSNYDDTALSGRVTTIEGKIPTQASSTNQLADKSFVNSSIATETAHYISNNGEPFTKVSDLPTTGVTNNDYAFVTGTESGNSYYDRYKATVSGSTVTWAKEFRLNNSSFTAEQWSAINSGATTDKINAIANKVDKEDGKGLFSGNYNDLTNKPTIPDAQIQSDWNQTDSTAKDYIKNKPEDLGKVDDVKVNGTTVVADKVANIKLKTINNQAITGEGNIEVATGGGTWGSITGTVTDQEDLVEYIGDKVIHYEEGTDPEEDYEAVPYSEYTAKVTELETNKQNKTDNTLTTTSKTIVGGINELNAALDNKAAKSVETEVTTLKSDISLLKALGLKVIDGYICQE